MTATVIDLNAVKRVRLTFAQELLLRRLSDEGPTTLHANDLITIKNLLAQSMAQHAPAHYRHDANRTYRITVRGRMWLQQKGPL